MTDIIDEVRRTVMTGSARATYGPEVSNKFDLSLQFPEWFAAMEAAPDRRTALLYARGMRLAHELLCHGRDERPGVPRTDLYAFQMARDYGAFSLRNAQPCGPVKIGSSADVNRRQKDLDQGSPYPLHFALRVVDVAAMHERTLHRSMTNIVGERWSLQHEWYEPCMAEVLAFLPDHPRIEAARYIRELRQKLLPKPYRRSLPDLRDELLALDL